MDAFQRLHQRLKDQIPHRKRSSRSHVATMDLPIEALHCASNMITSHGATMDAFQRLHQKLEERDRLARHATTLDAS